MAFFSVPQDRQICSSPLSSTLPTAFQRVVGGSSLTYHVFLSPAILCVVICCAQAVQSALSSSGGIAQ